MYICLDLFLHYTTMCSSDFLDGSHENLYSLTSQSFSNLKSGRKTNEMREVPTCTRHEHENKTMKNNGNKKKFK